MYSCAVESDQVDNAVDDGGLCALLSLAAALIEAEIAKPRAVPPNKETV